MATLLNLWPLVRCSLCGRKSMYSVCTRKDCRG